MNNINNITKIILLLFALGIILFIIYFLRETLFEKFDAGKDMLYNLFKFS